VPDGNLYRGKPMIARSARSPASLAPSARHASYPLGLKRALGLDRVAA
jgi:hypothetical protein